MGGRLRVFSPRHSRFRGNDGGNIGNDGGERGNSGGVKLANGVGAAIENNGAIIVPFNDSADTAQRNTAPRQPPSSLPHQPAYVFVRHYGAVFFVFAKRDVLDVLFAAPYVERPLYAHVAPAH